MFDERNLDRIMGGTVYDDSGDRIGSVDTVYVDDETNAGKFALVNTGLLGMKSSFVPLEGATMDGDDLRVPHSKDKVKDAPSLDPDGHLEPEQEQELFRYYGLDTGMPGGRTAGTAPTADAPSSATSSAPTAPTADALAPTADAPAPTADAGTGAGGTDDAMTRSEEELEVHTSQREAGRVRLRKHVVTENVTKTVPVRREEVRVEREPITDANVDAAMDGPALTEDEHEVVLHEEEVEVEKRTVPKERVRLDKEVHTEQEQVSEQVAHEEIDIVDEGVSDRRDV
jgi:uncharacterized protein (TIGR02271 family)